MPLWASFILEQLNQNIIDISKFFLTNLTKILSAISETNNTDNADVDGVSKNRESDKRGKCLDKFRVVVYN